MEKNVINIIFKPLTVQDITLIKSHGIKWSCADWGRYKERFKYCKNLPRFQLVGGCPVGYFNFT